MNYTIDAVIYNVDVSKEELKKIIEDAVYLCSGDLDIDIQETK